MRRGGDCFPKTDLRATQASHETVRTGTVGCNGCMTFDADVGRAVNVTDALKRKLNIGNGDPLVGCLNAKRRFLLEECVLQVNRQAWIEPALTAEGVRDLSAARTDGEHAQDQKCTQKHKQPLSRFIHFWELATKTVKRLVVFCESDADACARDVKID